MQGQLAPSLPAVAEPSIHYCLLPFIHVQVTAPLGAGAGIMAPGQYQFAFVFTLPTELPGSFSYNYGSDQ